MTAPAPSFRSLLSHTFACLLGVGIASHLQRPICECGEAHKAAPAANVSSAHAKETTAGLHPDQELFLEFLAAESAMGEPFVNSTFCEMLSNGFAYNKGIPTVQAGATILNPWASSLPPTPAGEALTGGTVPLFTDTRVVDAIRATGIDLRGKHIFELGPLEAGHSYLFARKGAYVTGVEGSPLAYLKTLLIKDTYNLNRFKPLFGNFVLTMELAVENKIRFDAVHASGVLYHMTEPMKVLHLISQLTDTAFFWSHYYLPTMKWTGRTFRKEQPTITVGGYTHTPQCFQYTSRGNAFLGGQEVSACLLTQEDIVKGLAHFGMEVKILMSNEHHPGGPEMTFVAQRIDS